MSDKKITYISLLQIIGPIFVILGHSLNGLESTGAWYVFSKEWIYIFHMPLFFMISGYLLSYKGYLNGRSYKKFVFIKAKRLLAPYIILNSFVWLIMLIYQFISNNISLSISEILIGFIRPRTNALTYTWFLFALFVVYLAAPIFQKLLNEQKPIFVVITFAVCITFYMLPINTELFALSDLHKDLLFFVLGCILGQMKQKNFISTMKRFRPWFIIGAILFSAIALIWYEELRMFHFIPCAFVLLAFLSIFVCVNQLSPPFERLASYSFSIYIMHWPVMMFVRIFFHSLLGANVALTAFAMCVFGYVTPIFVILIIRALPFNKIKVPLKYLLGV